MYKIIKKGKKLPLKDDLGREYQLFLVEEEKISEGEIVKNQTWVVLSSKKTKFANGVQARRREMFFKNNNKLGKYTFSPLIVGDKKILFQYAGATAMFEPYPLLNKKDKVCGVRVVPYVLSR